MEHGIVLKKKSCPEKTKYCCVRTWKNTIGNRRLRAYLVGMLKLTIITMIQANDSFPPDVGFFYTYSPLFLTLGYSWMAITLLLLTERYFRELLFTALKKPLWLWLYDIFF